MQSVRAFAPATVANVGPGFDVLGLALERPGDIVEVSRVGVGGAVILESISGDHGRLPRESGKNTAGVAARQVLERAGLVDPPGISIRVEKGLPLGSGLGSSGASAVAAAVATNHLLGSPLTREELFEVCRGAEAVACGSAHGDNVGPALYGGLLLLEPGTEPRPHRLPWIDGLHCALAHPELEVNTKDARDALPATVPLGDLVSATGRLATFVSALYEQDPDRLGSALCPGVVTKVRSRSIIGYADVHAAALASGAIGASISGSGPTVFALVMGAEAAVRTAEAMAAAFRVNGVKANGWASPIDPVGARVLD